MRTHYLPFRETGYFSSMICDYLDRAKDLKEFYGNYPDLDGFKSQIKQKKNNYSDKTRSILVNALKNQIKSTNTSSESIKNIDLLRNSKTFTVTTGHQLNLFTGPLYFLYKIGTAINLAKHLKKAFPECDFVPVYWMASEDHDFDEINFFNYNSKKVVWDTTASGAVGRMETTGLNKVFDSWAAELGNSENAIYLKELFRSAYLKNRSLGKATRFLVNELFGDHGLVIIDGDSPELKSELRPYIERELLHGESFYEVNKTNKKLEKFGKIQVNPREINLFYLKDNMRERIIKHGATYKINGSEIEFSETQMMEELQNHPERFSPNVITRPLYQELVLPNLCYIGGGGELAYWFQLKSYFEKSNLTFPILMLRQSVALITKKQTEKATRLKLSLNDLFNDQETLVNTYVRKYSELTIDFSPQRTHLKNQFDELKILAEQTDASFLGAVLAQEKKQLNGLDKLEKRMLKAQKRKMQEVLIRIKRLQDAIFPNQSLEERTRNLSEIYMLYGPQFISDLLEIIDPFCKDFTIAEY